MRNVRCLLLMLLCLAIPLQSMAGMLMPMGFCPMQQKAATLHMNGDHVATNHAALMTHDCCNDAETAAKTGKICKTGQDCRVSAEYPAFFQVSLPMPLAPAPQYLSYVPSVHSFDASSVWRPPTSL